MNAYAGNLILIGMPGSGKSTVGCLLAEQTGRAFYDMDEEIVRIAGRSIEDLFIEGEVHFRQWETKACEWLAQKKRAVIATGGGAILNPTNVTVLAKTGRLIYLSVPLGLLSARTDPTSRPLLQGAKDNGLTDRLNAMFEQRGRLYREAADLIVENTNSPWDAVRKIQEATEINGEFR